MSDIPQTLGLLEPVLQKSAGPSGTKDYLERLQDGPFLEPYITYGLGHGKDDKGHYLAVVLVHETAADAVTNAKMLQRRINETFSVYGRSDRYLLWSKMTDGIEIDYDRVVVRAKLRGNTIVSFWWDIALLVDPLLLTQ
ncbi:MAG: hypothetical protein O2854_03670 [Chloroflexi bacterium]|nr:hypothetical protein [Chloroflexota bacterium]